MESRIFVCFAGVFWIAWEDLCQYYDVIYLSWNPALFKDSSCIHRCVCVCVYLKCLFIMFCEHQDGNVGVNEILCTWGSGNRSKKHCFYQSKQTVKCLCSGLCAVCSSWDGKQGPVKDVYSLANNPQYKLEVQCPTGGAAVWVLLTRHITDKVELGQNDKVMLWWICVLFTPEQQWCYDVTLWGFNLSDDRFLFVYSGWFCTKQRVHHPRCLQDGWEEGLLPG